MKRLDARPAGAGDPMLVYMVGRLDQGIRQEMRIQLAEWDLSVREFTALSVLKRRPGLSNAQLARRSLVRPQSMNEILVKLEGRGLVRRAAGPNHARILRAALSEAGRELLATVEPAISEIEERLFADLSKPDRQIMLEVMRIAVAKLRSNRAGTSAGIAGAPSRDGTVGHFSEVDGASGRGLAP